MRGSIGLWALLLAAGTASCADETSVKVRWAEGAGPRPAAVSVLGVFRDGRMSVDAWGPMALPLSAALGASAVCEPAFSARLQRDNEPLFSSIDEQAKNEGITEDLLARLAPSAQGDVILAITMHGAVGRPDKVNDEPPRGQLPSMRGMGGPSAGRMGAAPQREPTRLGPPPKVLELAATLFSAKDKKPLARLSMIYGGTNADEAMKQFVVEIGKLLPGSSCKGWKWPAEGLPKEVAPILEGP